MIRVFGEVGIQSAGTGAVECLSKRVERVILAVLAAEPNTRIAASEITSAIWLENPPKTFRESLRNGIAAVRKALPETVAVLTTYESEEGTRYELEVDKRNIDHFAFREHMRGAERQRNAGNTEEATEELEAALALWGDDVVAFDGIEDVQRIVPLKFFLEDQRLSCIEQLAESYLTVGRFDACIQLVGPVASARDGRERLSAAYMRALNAAGRHGEARQLFQTLRTQLANAGIEPSSSIVELDAAIASRSVGLGERGPHDESRRGLFVGRHQLVAEVVASVRSQRTTTWCITGGAGMGKSRLLAETESAATNSRVAVIRARPADDFPTPFEVFDQVVKSFEALVPTARKPVEKYYRLRLRSRAANGAAVRTELTEIAGELARCTIKGFAALLVSIDDAHCIDEVSLHGLRAWSKSEPKKTSFLYLARSAPPGSNWGRFVGDLSSVPNSNTRALRPLTAVDIADWIRSLSNRPSISPESIAEPLHLRSAGNPYYLSHLVYELRTTKEPARFLARLSAPILPLDLAEVMHNRLRNLPQGTRRFLGVASIVGPRFDPVEIASLGREVFGDEDWTFDVSAAKGLVEQEPDTGEFRFDHDLTRAALAKGIGEHMVPKLHAAQLGRIRSSGTPLAIAHHAQAAVPELDPNVALQLSKEAAADVLRSGSFSTAAGLFQNCLELADMCEADEATKLDLRIARADAVQHLGMRDHALSELARVIDDAEQLGLPSLAARAALASADFGEVIDTSDPVTDLLARALAMQGEDSPEAPALASELIIKATISGRASVPVSDGSLRSLLTDDATTARAVTWLHESAGSPGCSNRLELARSALALGEMRSEVTREALDLLLFEIAALLELGETAAAFALIPDFADAADRSGRPAQKWLAQLAEADRLQLGGHLAEAEQRAQAAKVFASENNVPDGGGAFGIHLLINSVLTGTTATVDLRQAGEMSGTNQQAVDAGAALILAARGSLAKAEQLVTRSLEQLECGPTTTLTPLCLGLTAAACLPIGIRLYAERVTDLLEPYSGTFLRAGLVGGSLGPADLYLSALSSLLDRRDEASDYALRSLRLSQHAQTPLWELRCWQQAARVDAAPLDIASLEMLRSSIRSEPFRSELRSLLDG